MEAGPAGLPIDRQRDRNIAMRCEGKLVVLVFILVGIFGCAAYGERPPHHPA